MTFKSATQPFCRTCGKPIRKHTVAWFCGQSIERRDQFSRTVAARPTTRAECQQLTNDRVISVSYSGDGDRRHIFRFGTWDGESYDDEFFCTNACAISLAYASVRKFGLACDPWKAATKKEGNATP
jgi:ribosomal protein L32